MLRDGPLEKWWEGWEKKTKKNSCKGKCQEKKNSCKEEGKEKKFMQKECPIIQYYQAQYE